MHREAATRVQLAGPLLVEIQGRRLEDKLPGRQGRLLFAYLVANRGRPLRRGELTAAIWPERPPADPEAGLRTLLARLRKVVGDEVVQGRAELALALPGEAVVDVEVARQLVAEAEAGRGAGDPGAAHGAAREAAEITGRPLLPGLESPWIDDLRREWQELGTAAAEALARAALARGGEGRAEAERAARALIEREPYRESGYELLMGALAAGGNVAEALRTYEQARVLLRDELGVSPSPSLMGLHERLLRGEEKPPAGPAPVPATLARLGRRPFVGREPELERLTAAWRLAAQGERRLALIAGEPGIGKTRLAAQLAATAEAAERPLLYGRTEQESLAPYGAFAEALQHHVAHAPTQDLEALGRDDGPELARLLPELRRRLPDLPLSDEAESESRRFRLFEAVARLLGSLGEDGPALLILDDLHWADRPTLLLLKHVVRFREPSRLLVVGTFRDAPPDRSEELDEVITDLARDDLVERVTLQGLDERETAALVEAWAPPRATGAEPADLRARTRGNPFFIGELLREPAAGGVEGVPEGVRSLVGQRVAALGDPASEALALAAVIGETFSPALAERALGRPLVTELDAALASRLVVEVEDLPPRYAFAHAIVRETLVQGLTPARKASLHGKIAGALEGELEDGGGHSYAELALHSLAAGRTDAQAVTYALHAGDAAAAMLAYEEAAAHYRRGLGALGSGVENELACQLLIRLGEAERRAGDRDSARAEFLRAAAVARAIGSPAELARAALGFGGPYVIGLLVDEPLVELLEEALEQLPESDSPLRARVLARLAEALYFSTRREEGMALSEQAVAIAGRLDDPSALQAALNARRHALWGPDYLEERLEVDERLLAVSRQLDDRELMLTAHHWRSIDLFENADPEGAAAAEAEQNRLAAELQQPFYGRFPLIWAVLHAQLEGRFDELERLAMELFELNTRVGQEDGPQVLAVHIGRLRREQGRHDELLGAVEAFLAQFPDNLAWRSALLMIHADLEDEEAARRDLDLVAANDFADVPRDLLWLPTLADIAEATAWLGDRRRAELLYELMLPYERRVVLRGALNSMGSAARYLGMLARSLGRAGDAVRHLELALATDERLGSPPYVAYDRKELALALWARAGDGDESRAESLAAQAMATAMELGMKTLERSLRSNSTRKAVAADGR